MSQKKKSPRYFLTRCFECWWFQLILGTVVLVLISLVMFDAVALSITGSPVFFRVPK